MSHYKPYPAYKDSGVEWIGEVPEHWEIAPIKRLGKLKGGSGFPPEMQGRLGNELPFFKVGDLGKSLDGVPLGEAKHTISREEAVKIGATIFQKNTLAWAKMGAALSLNRRRILLSDCCLDNNMKPLRCFKWVESEDHRPFRIQLQRRSEKLVCVHPASIHEAARSGHPPSRRIDEVEASLTDCSLLSAHRSVEDGGQKPRFLPSLNGNPLSPYPLNSARSQYI
ncbi:hypothetical protein [Methylacidimicrobium sp. B4]|uniref:hypothetical protein n=1 Tax=Methylacidimicrobium sp. B4 TaxID=2796139 RepID=UPI001F5CAFC7|nr:hypothetical protein [Methylacidimicrobium sp. B4]